MDGNMDVESQIRLVRTVIGRKTIELDDFIDKAYSNSEDASSYEALIDFLKNDIKGLKALAEDMKVGASGSPDKYYEITTLPERMVGLYNDVYLPSIKEEDYSDEIAVMKLKSTYKGFEEEDPAIAVGRAALGNPLLINLMSANEEILATIGKMVLSDPELISALNQ